MIMKFRSNIRHIPIYAQYRKILLQSRFNPVSGKIEGLGHILDLFSLPYWIIASISALSAGNCPI